MIKLLKLIPLLLLTLVLDLLLYSFSGVCPSCGSFSQFLQTPASLAGPILASLTILMANLTKEKK